MDVNDALEQKARIEYLLDIQKRQLGLADDAEANLMRILWGLRGRFKVEQMSRWTGWSKQTLYNKWAKHGLKDNNAQYKRDQE